MKGIVMSEKALLSAKGRVSFPSVYEATKVKDDDKPKYSLTLVYRHKEMEGAQLELLKRMKAEADKCAREAFGAGIGERDEEGTVIKSPFRPTEDKPKYYDPGGIFIRFANKYRPTVVDAGKRKIREDSDDFYAGCWAHVSYTVYAYTYMGNKGVSFSLGNVQKTGDDEPFAGKRTDADDDFDVIEEEEGAMAADVSADDIPF